MQSNDFTMDLRRDVFQAIADPTRRAILLLIASQSMTPSAIAAYFDSTRQTISKHIQILTACELLQQQSQGREIYYHLNPSKMEEVEIFTQKFREMWEARFLKMDTILENINNKK